MTLRIYGKRTFNKAGPGARPLSPKELDLWYALLDDIYRRRQLEALGIQLLMARRLHIRKNIVG